MPSMMSFLSLESNNWMKLLMTAATSSHYKFNSFVCSQLHQKEVRFKLTYLFVQDPFHLLFQKAPFFHLKLSWSYFDWTPASYH
mmetsp:Transcript_26038/g.34684  ORF Transcript_26038/g.34684 Transcript_26038/m.34684 type:complete len:84 (-) Transcript_26038:146-397(-)